MTDAEKKMKKYTNSVERRLNLPKDVKARVMSDFLSSIAARREAGQTDEEIYAELGTPKKAAADLNEQMKEFAYRKSPWRLVFLGVALLSGAWLFLRRSFVMFRSQILGVFSFPVESSSIGIIGGADGPTAIFVTAPRGFAWDIVIVTTMLLIGVFGYLRLRKCRQK